MALLTRLATRHGGASLAPFGQPIKYSLSSYLFPPFSHAINQIGQRNQNTQL